jgi:hypothetical protein
MRASPQRKASWWDSHTPCAAPCSQEHAQCRACYVAVVTIEIGPGSRDDVSPRKAEVEVEVQAQVVVRVSEEAHAMSEESNGQGQCEWPTAMSDEAMVNDHEERERTRTDCDHTHGPSDCLNPSRVPTNEQWLVWPPERCEDASEARDGRLGR